MEVGSFLRFAIAVAGAISCSVRKTVTSRPWSNVILVMCAGEGGQQSHATVVSALIKQSKTLANELYKSLTPDRRKELADHRRFALATNIQVCLCDSAKSVAARIQREHQWSAQAVFSERDRLVGVFSNASAPAKRTATQDLGIRNPGREI
jgi:hypothetical protein